MRILLILILFTSITTFGQPAIEAYNKGNEKMTAQDYAGSIKEYDKALVLDPKFADAYYNRGTSKLYLKNYSGAADDFTKAIQLKPDFVNAYSNRANAKINLNDFKGALLDFNAVIKLNPKSAITYLMRGQVKLNLGEITEACPDFNRAKELGESRADNFLKQYCAAMTGKESLKLEWPAAEKWKIVNEQENEQQRVSEWIREGETLENWTELVTMTAIKGVTGVPVDKAMNMMLDQAKKEAPDAKLMFIEKDEKAEHPWIIFTIESPRFINDNNPESQMWYIVQGKQALYTNFRAVKKATITPELKEKWSKFFKSGNIVNQ